MATKAQYLWNADEPVGVVVTNKSCRVPCCALLLPACIVPGLSQVTAPPPHCCSTLLCCYRSNGHYIAGATSGRGVSSIGSLTEVLLLLTKQLQLYSLPFDIW